MDKNSLLAVILSVVVITAGFMIQAKFFPAPEPVQTEVSASTVEESVPQTAAPATTTSDSTVSGNSDILPASVAVEAEEQIPHQEVRWETNLFDIVFSNKGGVITSLKLKKHLENGEPLEMLLKGAEDQNAFNILFGGPTGAPITENFHYRRINDETFEFYRTFIASDGNPFILRKTYIFKPNDYLMELDITIENSVSAAPALNNGGYAYTLEFGPQIGPSFTKLDGRYAYRNYYTFTEKKANKLKVKDGIAQVEGRVQWAGIAGKYFTVVGIPDQTDYDIAFNQYPKQDLLQSSVMTFSRPVITNVSKSVDVFRFYIGPKNNKALAAYDKAEDNGFSLGNLELDNIVDTSSILGWLEWILKQMLFIAYKLIHNYGIAIILVTVVVKAVMFPFTRKSYQSTSKMQALAPQMEELKKKFKDKPEKLNKETAALYKKEGVNPLGGCLPMLIQMPIFIAMYGLFNKLFELRGAAFIPGWISDLSAPEAVYTFNNFTLPILGWDAIRLLPILFVLTQLLYGKLMQTGSQGSNSQMKMMNTLMPVMFFFILYNAPSGLLLYWIASNIITAIQQVVTNKVLNRDKGEA
ncbi:MAG: membrane protein insertase YidC [Spirochaetales bacterium]|nr:membrane protein insertase YidC [Spirochaetales bacterium]